MYIHFYNFVLANQTMKIRRLCPRLLFLSGIFVNSAPNIFYTSGHTHRQETLFNGANLNKSQIYRGKTPQNKCT